MPSAMRLTSDGSSVWGKRPSETESLRQPTMSLGAAARCALTARDVPIGASPFIPKSSADGVHAWPAWGRPQFCQWSIETAKFRKAPPGNPSMRRRIRVTPCASFADYGEMLAVVVAHFAKYAVRIEGLVQAACRTVVMVMPRRERHVRTSWWPLRASGTVQPPATGGTPALPRRTTDNLEVHFGASPAKSLPLTNVRRRHTSLRTA